MSLLLAAASGTAPPPPTTGGLPASFGDAMLPFTLPRLATITASPGDDPWTQAAALQDAATSLPWRERIVEVVLAPGTYPSIGQRWLVVRSSTGNPADVVIETGATQGGVLHWWGDPMWIKGVTLRSLPNPGGGFGPKYPLHITGGGVLTLVDCVLDSQNAGSDGGPAIVGMDGADGTRFAMVGCELRNLGGILANIHGGGPVGPHGVEIGLKDCTVTSPGTSHVLGFAGVSGERTELWVEGGNITLDPSLTDALAGGLGHTNDGTWPATIGGFAPYQRLAYGIP